MASLIFKNLMSMAIILELVMVNSLISSKEVKNKRNVISTLAVSGRVSISNV